VDRDKFSINSDHSLVTFSIGFMGLTHVEGRFTGFIGTILYDDSDLTKCSVTALIDATSINTGSEFRDQDLKGANWFDVKQFPFIKFQSTLVEKSGQGYIVHGTFTLRGVTKIVSFPLTMLHPRMGDGWENTRVGFEGKLSLDRRDYEIVGPEFWNKILSPGRISVGDEVSIDLQIEGLISNFERRNLPDRLVAATIWKTLNEGGITSAVKRYRDLKTANPDGLKFEENGLNIVGNRLL
jgi:polyisoprenoid-binding protein YceI